MSTGKFDTSRTPYWYGSSQTSTETSFVSSSWFTFKAGTLDKIKLILIQII